MKSSLTYYTSLVFLICCMALIITSVDIFKAYVPLKGITILIPIMNYSQKMENMFVMRI